ncbi:hypothetical protein [Prosthecobacter vanneervenii]|uniref:Uncharacterized protein n=1 Tax=Prosthecobacter vanneervenii TaxID=48466 RepID=A0A7W8DL66_9BACT|nr:hypothetical protein [Prosthecobacter vanneervenii]MBB5034039.1 hypothetical protein [Prosthecobacter vanneervenii]
MKLNALLKTLGFLALAATPVVAGTSAPAPKNPIAPAPANDDLGITASIGYDSNYVWRGINYGQHWVRAGLNGGILLVGGAAEDGAGSTSLLWDVNYGSLAGDQDHFSPTLGAGSGINSTSSFQRLQLGAAISHDFGPASVSFGYSFIHNMGALANGSGLNQIGFPASSGYGMNDIQQLTLGLNTNLGPIALASSANYDLFNGGWYFDVTAKSTIAVTDAISIVPHVGLGYGLNYNAGFTQGSRNLIGGGGLNGVFGGSSYTKGVTGWTALNVGIDFPIKLNSRATLTPYVAWNLPMGPYSNLARSATQPYFFGGVGGGPATAFHSVAYYGVTLSVRF